MDVDSILDFDPNAAKERLCDTMNPSVLMGELGSGESFQLPNMDKVRRLSSSTSPGCSLLTLPRPRPSRGRPSRRPTLLQT